MILIFALWVLAFLAVLSVTLGGVIRQKIMFIQRLDQRNRIEHVAQAGVKKAVAVILEDMVKHQMSYSRDGKTTRHNNSAQFKGIRLDGGTCDVSYTVRLGGGAEDVRYGIVDEERKINLNYVDVVSLQRLLMMVLSLKDEDAGRLSRAIIDWREYGTSEPTGFYSDEYYSNLERPYNIKSSNYEMMDELLLVKGVTGEVFQRISAYLTVYGDGRVNINTASIPVLLATGLSEMTVDKILKVRRGKDGKDFTADDHIFVQTFDIASEVASEIKLEPDEIRQIDEINLKGLLTTNSYYYSIQSTGRLENSKEQKTIYSVFSTLENRIVYWKEK